MPSSARADASAHLVHKPMTRGAFWLMLRRVAVVAGCVDVIYLVAFALLDMPVIAALNLVSAGSYALAWWLLGRRRNHAAALIMWLEVVLHSGAITLLLGWDAGTHYFLMVFLPALAVGRNRRHTLFGMVFLLGLYLGLDALARVVPVSYVLPPPSLLALRWLSISVVFAMFGYIARFYVYQVYSAERELSRQATTDPLSGLHNRRCLLEHARQARQASLVDGSPLAVLLGDIDHFKRINDGWGHSVGDQVITHVARLIRAELTAQQHLARWGGEEFLALLPEMTPAAALALCMRLKAALEAEPLLLADGRQVRVTLSFGVAAVDAAGSFDAAVAEADQNLYEAKRRGRNCAVWRAPGATAGAMAGVDAAARHAAHGAPQPPALARA